VGKLYEKFKIESEETGYNVNSDVEFVEMLLENIEVNIERYGYGACPCRLASGNREEDLDLICPCDYRDVDLEDYGACFCALYVTEDILEGKKKLSSIPDRRLKELESKKSEKKQENVSEIIGKLKYPIYRCKVCGYLCSREKPPIKCPICKVSADRFERIL
jgi:ferredoxin-thioredoxin reductase catalytic subunit